MSDEDKHFIETETVFKSLQTSMQAMEARMLGMDGRMDRHETRMDDLEKRLLDRIEKSENNLLTAFQQWASPMEARVRSHSATLRALDLEMETNLAAIKARIDELEGRQPKQ